MPRESGEPGRSSRAGSALRRRATVLLPQFEEDMAYWLGQDPRIARRIWQLMRDVKRDPFVGIGKPEPVKGWGQNVWSRRIDDEHRLVYAVHDDRIEFLQARYHYER